MYIDIIDEKSYKNILDMLLINTDMANIYINNFIKSYKYNNSSHEYILKANVSQKKKEDIEFIYSYFDKSRSFIKINNYAKFLRKL